MEGYTRGVKTSKRAAENTLRFYAKNANIDKLDNCDEVTMGLGATIGITLLLWVLAMPIFELFGTPWMHSWEGSGLSMHNFRGFLEDRSLLPEVVAFTLEARHLHYVDVTESAKLHKAFYATVRQRVAIEAGNSVTAEEVSLMLSPMFSDGITSSRVECLVRIPNEVDGTMLKGTIESSLPDLSSRLELDLNANPVFGKKAETKGTLTVHTMSGTVVKTDVREAFAQFDQNADGLSSWEDFLAGTKSLDLPINVEQARHAHAGLDENQDGVVELLEFEEALTHKHFFHFNQSSFTTMDPASISTTTTTRTTTTHEVGAMVVPAEPTHTTTAPAPAPSTTYHALTVAVVKMRVLALRWNGLNHTERDRMATAFRKDLAYASGILSSQVMDANGHEGCVSMSPAPDEGPTRLSKLRLRRLTEHGKHDKSGESHGHLLMQGCLPIPEGATIEDIEAVVTSGTETHKLVKDFRAVDGGHPVGTHDVDVSVTAHATCQVESGEKSTADAFCEEPPKPKKTTEKTTKAPTTPAPTQAPSQELMDMAEFLSRMPSSQSESPRKSFSAIDGNGNEFSDPAEFRYATKNFPQPLTEKESENMFDWLDKNHDGRIESLEFFQAYKTAQVVDAPDKPPIDAPITLAQYRKALGHEVEYTKIGVGLCRTAAEAWPKASEHPEGTSKESCQNLCKSSDACGAFAFKVGGTCRLYPSTKAYPDTTPMTDVECFAKEFSEEATFDLARVRLTFSDAPSKMPKDKVHAAASTLAEKVAFEVGAPTSTVRSALGETGVCSFLGSGDQHEHSGPKSHMQAICVVQVPSGRRLEDLVAVLNAATTKSKLVDSLSALPSMPHLDADALKVSVQGSSAAFRKADADNGGAVNFGEFITASKQFPTPLSQESAEFAFRGLDVNSDNQLSPDEFEARGMEKLFKAPSFL